jgi:hypothetical protein
MNKEGRQAGWGFWLLWVTASVVGFALGATAVGYFGAAIIARTPPLIVAAAQPTLFVVLATLPGFLHWLILRKWFSRAGWWVLASGGGSLLGFLPLGWGLAVADTHGDNVSVWFVALPTWVVLLVAIAVAGAVAGAMQWLVLRLWVSRAGWWVLASSIGWVAATFVYAYVTRANDVHLPLGGAVSGALSGAITGLTLVELMRNTRNNDPASPVPSVEGRR